MTKVEDTTVVDDKTEVVEDSKENEVLDKNTEGTDQLSEEDLELLAGGVKGELIDNPDPLATDGEKVEAIEEDEAGGAKEVKPGTETPPPPVTDVKTEEVKQAATATQEDPGDFKPGDYSFEVKTSDGKTVKISTPEEAEAFAAKLDDDPSIVSASQFLALGRKTAAMEQRLEQDRKVWEDDKKKFDAQQEQGKAREKTTEQWGKEINYLRGTGKLPTITPEQSTADWSDPEVAKQSGIKEVMDVFKWMETENGRRVQAGLAPMQSFLDAYRGHQEETREQQVKEEADKATKVRQTKGGMVTGNAPHIPSNTPKNSIVGEGGTLNDLMADFYAT